MKRIVYILSALTALILYSCKESSTDVHNVEAEFEPYIQKFFSDAINYGVNIEDKNLVMKFAHLKNGMAGVTYMERIPICIEIDVDAWNNMIGPNGENMKEDLIFHEMGHAFLKRLHQNDTLRNGDWQSMMCGDELPHGRGSNINYRGMRKGYYIKELFTESAEIPAWSTYIPDFSKLKEHTYLNATTDTTLYWVIGKKEGEYEGKIDNKIYQYTSYSDGTMYIPLKNASESQDIYDVSMDFYFETNIKVTTDGSSTDPSFGIGFANYNEEQAEIIPMHYMIFHNNSKLISIGELSCVAPFIQLYNANIKQDDYNTIAIRKQQDTLYYYLNGNFIYHNDLNGIPVSGNSFGLTVGARSTIYVTGAKINVPDGTKSASALPCDGREVKPLDLGILFTPQKSY